MNEFQKFVYAEMRNRDLSMRKFAELIGVSHGTISNTLREEKPTLPSLELLTKMAKALKINFFSILRLAYPEVEGDPVIVDADIWQQQLARLSPERRHLYDLMMTALLQEQERDKLKTADRGGTVEGSDI